MRWGVSLHIGAVSQCKSFHTRDDGALARFLCEEWLHGWHTALRTGAAPATTQCYMSSCHRPVGLLFLGMSAPLFRSGLTFPL